jgi:Tol biopolymer transport system component
MSRPLVCIATFPCGQRTTPSSILFAALRRTTGTYGIRVSGEDLERLTFHGSRVSHPVLLDEHTLAYLASDAQGAGPWLYALNLTQRVPHRISFGLERYGSLAASASGERLLATVEDSQTSVWSMPLGPAAATDSETRSTPAASQVVATGFAPRTGPDYLVYVSAPAGRQGIWKIKDGQTRELWSDVHASIVGGPAVTRDGRSIVSAALRDGEPRLMKISLDGSPPTQLVPEYSIDPTWSPDGEYLIYSGADVGTTFVLRAVAIRDFDVTRDGRSIEFDRIREGSRIALIDRGAVEAVQ